jgi:hypothetical protein
MSDECDNEDQFVQFEADAEAEEMFRVLCSSDECTGDVMESFAAAVKGQITTLNRSSAFI